MSTPPDIADHIRTALAHPEIFGKDKLLELLQQSLDEIDRLSEMDEDTEAAGSA